MKSRFVAVLAALALAALAVPVVRSIGSLELDSSADVLLAGDERNAASYERLGELLERRTLVSVLLTGPEWFSDEGAAVLYELGEALDAVPGTDDVKSLTHSWRPVRKGLSLDIEELVGFERFVPIAPRNAVQWARRKELVLSYPLAKDLFVSSDGVWAMVLAVVDRPLADHASKAALRDEVVATVAPFADRVEALHVFAFPFVEADMREAVGEDLSRFLIAVIVLVVLILALTFRSLPMLLVVLVSEAVGLALIPVVFHLNGAAVNLYTGMLFPLVAGLQLAFLVHLGTALAVPLRRGVGVRTACREALDIVLVPSLVAAVTTALGLLALLTCDVGLVREFGWLGAQAVLVVFGVSFVPPLLVAGRSPPAEEAARDVSAPGTWSYRIAGFLAHGPLRRPLLVVLLAALVVAVCVPFIADLRTDIRALEFLDPQSEARTVLGVLDQHLGGINTYELVVDTERAGGAHDLEVLAFVEELRTFAESRPGVTNAYGYSQIFKLLNQLWFQDAPGSDRLPDSAFVLQGFVAALAASPFPLGDRFTDADQSAATVVLRTRDMPAREYLALLEDVLLFSEEMAPEGVTLRSKEGLHTLLDADRRIVSSQVKSLAVGLGAILVLLAVSWRSIGLALCVVVANAGPLAVVLALMSLFGTALNSITVMVAASVLGISVDDGIHVVAAWRAARRDGSSPREAWERALALKLRPVACTTAILSSSLALFALTSFPPVAQFGLASAVALALAWLSLLVVLPALALLLTPARERHSGG